MKNTLKKACLISSALIFSGASAFAGGFTSGKNVFDFNVDYEGKFSDNSAGSKNKLYNNSIEVDAELGLTEDASLGFEAYFDKTHERGDDANNIASDKGNWGKGLLTYHRMNFNVNESINLGTQFGLAFLGNGDGTYSANGRARGMIRHDTKSGFYKHSRFEIEYRRAFDENAPDRVRFDFRTKFRLASGVDLYIRLMPNLELASHNFINNNPSKTSVSSRDLKRVKIAYTDLNIGPDFKVGKDAGIHAYYTMRLEGANEAKRTHAKGILVGYSKSFNL
jgi:hypothetical protein